MSGFRSASAYRLFAQKVRTASRFVRDAEDQEFLETLLRQVEADRKTTIRKGAVLWRAQLGFAWEPIWDGEKYIDDCIEGPFSPERMKPLRDRAREGRANPQGIPYLYLSTRKETALTEVRPWLHSLISIAQFKTARELVIADFSTDERPRRIEYAIPPEEWDKAVWYAIDQAFRRPIQLELDTPSEYAPTQVIAEFFKGHGYDGIAYQSAFQSADGKGHNLVLFDLDAAELFNCCLEEVTVVNFSFTQVSNHYFVRPKTAPSDNNKPPTGNRSQS